MAAPTGRVSSFLLVTSTGTPDPEAPLPRVVPEDFPDMLVAAVGRENLLRAARRDEISREQLEQSGSDDDEPDILNHSLSDFPETGALIGRNLLGGVYFSFLVSNPHFEKINEERKIGAGKALVCCSYLRSPSIQTAGITVMQYRDSKRGDLKFGIHPVVGCWLEQLPTNDERLCLRYYDLTKENCDAIREIFEGRHPDLRLVAKFDKAMVQKPQGNNLRDLSQKA